MEDQNFKEVVLLGGFKNYYHGVAGRARQMHYASLLLLNFFSPIAAIFFSVPLVAEKLYVSVKMSKAFRNKQTGLYGELTRAKGRGEGRQAG